MGLVHPLERLSLLAEQGGEALDPDRPTAEAIEHREENRVVHRLEADRVDAVELEPRRRDLDVDRGAAVVHLREVADPLEVAVRDPRGAARAPCDLGGAAVVEADVEDASGALQDTGQLVDAVVVEAVRRAEAIAQRRVQEPGRVVAATSVRAGASRMLRSDPPTMRSSSKPIAG
jgi:hypothetical protein